MIRMLLGYARISKADAAEIGRLFRVHRATIGRVAAEARAAQSTIGERLPLRLEALGGG